MLQIRKDKILKAPIKYVVHITLQTLWMVVQGRDPYELNRKQELFTVKPEIGNFNLSHTFRVKCQYLATHKHVKNNMHSSIPL